jgi:hypothetical protein
VNATQIVNWAIALLALVVSVATYRLNAAREIGNAAAESPKSLYRRELIDPKKDWQELTM